ncbi:hypothetical protein T4A_4305, partial [Trichinella pseudospiralis]
LKYLAIPEIKNTVSYFHFSHIILVSWNLDPADAVVSLMSMTIYGKASRLLCRHLLYQASTKSFLNDAEYFSFYHHLVVVVLHCRLRDGRSWHEIIGSLTVQSCILRVCCAKEVHNHKRTKVQSKGIQANERIVERRSDYANFFTAKGIAWG